MRNSPQSPRTAIAVLRAAVEAWRFRQRWSRESVCDVIVALHQNHGWDAETGLWFEPNADEGRRQQTNAERIYRWLDESKHSNLMPANFQRSILAALPTDLRITAADELLGGTGLVCRLAASDAAQPLDAAALCATVAKESSEAVAAVAALVQDRSRERLLAAQRELTESLAEGRAALEQVEAQLVAGDARLTMATHLQAALLKAGAGQ